MKLTDLLNSTYSYDGMGPRQFNCWGLVRAGLHGLFGIPLLPAYGDIHPHNKVALTRAWGEVGKAFEPCGAEPGAMACFFEGDVLEHIGLVIERRAELWVLHTNETTGPVQTPVRHAARLAQRVRYYRYVEPRV